MPTPNELIAEARTWLGTPFHPNQHVKFLGADCVGLIYGIGAACGITFPERRTVYPMRPDGTLKPYLDKHLIMQTEAGPADILLMAFDSEPHHLALYTGSTIIHSYVRVRKCIEQPMADIWWPKVCGIYRFRELAA